ncbi:hypothetical protein VTK56DRAFT_7657 [Thermocarpiscus australiensis]
MRKTPLHCLRWNVSLTFKFSSLPVWQSYRLRCLPDTCASFETRTSSIYHKSESYRRCRFNNHLPCHWKPGLLPWRRARVLRRWSCGTLQRASSQNHNNCVCPLSQISQSARYTVRYVPWYMLPLMSGGQAHSAAFWYRCAAYCRCTMNEECDRQRARHQPRSTLLATWHVNQRRLTCSLWDLSQTQFRLLGCSFHCPPFRALDCFTSAILTMPHLLAAKSTGGR